jgi:cystathionine gamma-synthase
MQNLTKASWLVSAGRPEEPGAPLNTPPVPASNFLLGGEREYARDGGTRTWEALETVVGGLEGGCRGFRPTRQRCAGRAAR